MGVQFVKQTSSSCYNTSMLRYEEEEQKFSITEWQTMEKVLGW